MQERLDRLERQVRRQRAALLACAAVGATVALCGAGDGGTVTCRELRVVGADGATAVAVQATPRPAVVLFGAEHRPRVMLSATPDGLAALAVASVDGRHMATVTARADHAGLGVVTDGEPAWSAP